MASRTRIERDTATARLRRVGEAQYWAMIRTRIARRRRASIGRLAAEPAEGGQGGEWLVTCPPSAGLYRPEGTSQRQRRRFGGSASKGLRPAWSPGRQRRSGGHVSLASRLPAFGGFVSSQGKTGFEGTEGFGLVAWRA
jgi:hypothetical protein